MDWHAARYQTGRIDQMPAISAYSAIFPPSPPAIWQRS